ncbi:MAG: hypothetical protein ACJ73S_17960 [Mycobacteriales bacterium]
MSSDEDELDDMDRRELLRLLSMAGTLVALPPALDAERLGHVVEGSRPLDTFAMCALDRFDSYLWGVFGLAQAKASVFPIVRQQVGVLTQNLDRPQTEATRRHLHALTASLFQLAGEICFDRNRYTDAAHCYTTAAIASPARYKTAAGYVSTPRALMRSGEPVTSP